MPRNNTKITDTLIQTFKKRIVHEDNHILAINKLAGWLSQGDYTHDPSIMEIAKAYLIKEYNKPGDAFIGCVHRLDRPVSGIVLLAKTSKALSRLNKAFEMREVKKEYLAIVNGRPNDVEALLTHYLIKNSRTRTTTAYTRQRKDAKKAELLYSVLQSSQGKSLIHVQPRTGRPHQIRVQLASLRTPILGDLRYGAKSPLPDRSIALHAWRLSFIHPVSKENLKLSCLPAKDKWWNLALENKFVKAN